MRATTHRLLVALTAIGVLAGATAAGVVLLRSGPEAAVATEPPATTTSPEETVTTAPVETTAPTTSPPTTTPPTTPPTTAPPTAAPPTSAPPPADPIGLRLGAEGDDVLLLQQALASLGYWLGEPDGRYAGLTQQAVMAFQKASGLARDGIAGPATLEALAVATRPTASVVSDGIELDLARQLIFVVHGGELLHVLNTSTGRSGWRTPAGDFTIDRQIDGMRHAELGDLYRPKYFNGGIAVHGSGSIPGQPASHGCARVSFAAMDMLWSSGLAEMGTRVVVY